MTEQSATPSLAINDLLAHTSDATSLLRAMAHNGRFQILCHLSEGERTVRELEHLLNCRQAAVSQQLMRLREDRLVKCRREGKAAYYTIASSRVREVLGQLGQIYSEDLLTAERGLAAGIDKDLH